MKSIIELIVQLFGGVVLVFLAGWVIAHITGYDEYYDKMLYDDDETDLTIKNNNTYNDDDIHRIHF